MTNSTNRIPNKQIYCCECKNQSEVHLVGGDVIYPHRPDLYCKNFWKCLKCNNYVGCHDNSKNPTKEMGFIAGKEMKKARQFIHALLDPMWKGHKDRTKRGFIYNLIADELGKKEYHTAKIKTIEEAREVYKMLQNIPGLIKKRNKKKQLVKDDYLSIKPIKGKRYLVKKSHYGNEWVESTFKERIDSSCQLHGDPYLDYYFDSPHIHFSIDGDLSLKLRTEELKKYIKTIDSISLFNKVNHD